MRADFNPQPTLQNDTLILRPLAKTDRDGLFAMARDPAVWAGHPARNRHEPAVFDPYFEILLASGGTLAVFDRANGRVIGCSRYYEAPDQPKSIAIGYTFLGRQYWGGSTNMAMKTLMFDHAFQKVDTIWLHIDPSNIRSQHATARLGAAHAYDAALIMGGKAGLWQCWRITRADWANRRDRGRS
jgi:N-acetyltransferase